MPHTICFDLDDTLIDDELATLKAVSAYLADHNELQQRYLDAPKALAAWNQATKTHYPRFSSGELSFDEVRHLRVEDFFGRTFSQDAALERFDDYLNHYQASWVPFSDTLEVLTQLKTQGIQLAVITNSPLQQAEQKLKATGLTPFMSGLYAPDSFGVGKPNPEFYRLSMADLGVTAAQCWMVGDHFERDVFAAEQAGMTGFWLRLPHQPERDFSRTLYSLTELLHHLQGANKG